MATVTRATLLLPLALAACSTPAPQAARPQPTSGAQALPPPPPPPPPSALVRVIHASPDPMAQAVLAYMDNGQTPALPELRYRAAVGYAPVPPGAHAVQARLPGMSPSMPAPINWNTPDLQAGRAYTIVAHGLASDLSGPQVTFAHEEDAAAAPTPGRANVRFFHALVGGGTVDVCLGGTTPAFVGVAYGSFGTAHGTTGRYVGASPGAQTVTFRAHAPAASPCAGRVVGSVPVQLADGATVTLVAVGRIARGPSAVAPEVLVCNDAPPGASQCAPVPVTAGR